MMGSFFVLFAALNGALAVAGGAFAAHALDRVNDAERIGWLRTAAEYQMFHVLALLAISALAETRPPLLDIASWCFALGIVFFCGSLYLMVLTGQRWLGAVTPLGGVLFIAGWLLLAFFSWRAKA